MLKILLSFYKRYLSQPEAGQLLFILALSAAVILGMREILMPVFISIVLAYLLEMFVNALSYCKIPRRVAVVIVFSVFIGIVAAIFTFLLPILIKQVGSLATALPNHANKAEASLQIWLQKVSFISNEHVWAFINGAKAQLYSSLKLFLASFLTFIPSVLTGIVYFVMVPLLVYFLLMDKQLIMQWGRQFLPDRCEKLNIIGEEVYGQIGNYVRGKVLEAVIVMVITYTAFTILGLDYAALLAILVGLSVFIPYVGAIAVTIPVVICAFLQFGLSSHLIYLLIVYACLMAFDGTILTALLFSEAVALHPLAIIVATIIFGGIGGIGGIFFAIPLACLVKALLTHWPTQEPSLRAEEGSAVKL